MKGDEKLWAILNDKLEMLRGTERLPESIRIAETALDLARRAFPAVAHPAGGAVRVTASPYHVDGAPVGPAGPAPYRVGEDTRAVLAEVLGYPASRIDALLGAGAIATP